MHSGRIFEIKIIEIIVLVNLKQTFGPDSVSFNTYFVLDLHNRINKSHIISNLTGMDWDMIVLRIRQISTCSSWRD